MLTAADYFLSPGFSTAVRNFFTVCTRCACPRILVKFDSPRRYSNNPLFLEINFQFLSRRDTLVSFLRRRKTMKLIAPVSCYEIMNY